MNFWLFTPELSLLVFIIIVIGVDLSTKRTAPLVAVSLIGLAVSAGFAIWLWGGAAQPQATFFNMLAVDRFAIFFKLLFLGIAALVILASVDYVHKFEKFTGEFFALILVSTLGMMLMAATNDLISIYIAL